MSFLIRNDNDLQALKNILELVIKEGQDNGNYLEILNCLLQSSRHKKDQFVEFKDIFFNIIGDPARKGWDKATRVYENTRDFPYKPSYRKRLLEYPDIPKRSDLSYINQIDKIVTELTKKPGYNILSFVFLRPADLYDKVRPGYVPCPIAGDFKFRKGKLHLNVMFRTCDALTVLYADMFYLRKLQEEVLFKAKKSSRKSKIQKAEIGNLSLYFSRVFIQKAYRYKEKGNTNVRSIKLIPLVKRLIDEIGCFQ
ncbi:MAG: hypothetical protein KAT49_04135 [Methanomicrobia archaeon]|nr:hypothetical protein [Methanomicrobia archaeon]